MIERKTKVICTLGPSSSTYEQIKELANNGMNVARLNFSHGSHQEHKKKIDIINKLKEEGFNIGILLDTKGPEIRLCEVENNHISFNANDTVKIFMHSIGIGNNEQLSISYPELINFVNIGTIVKVDDGKLNFEVIDVNKDEDFILVKALNPHVLTSKKSVGVPFTRLPMPFISKKDYEDLVFACENKVDYIAASFTRSKQDVLDLRKVLEEHNGLDIKVLAKIENQEGVENISEILEVVDGVMVARGDLGIELNFEDVPVIQKELVEKAKNAGKIVIIATQMLESMIHSPAPTRAEVSDVANAVYDGVDAIMLSGETASGDYPNKACEMEARIAKRIEKEINYEKFANESYQFSNKDNNDSIAYSVVTTAHLTNSKLIICFSKTGNTARRVSFYRPQCPIVSISDDPIVKGKLTLNYGVYGIYIPYYKVELAEFEKLAIKVAKKLGVKENESVLLTGGDSIGNTNFMKIITIK